MTMEEAEAIEQSIESTGELSAIVDSVEGVATYPSLVAFTADYQSLVEIVAHEWMHHYLFFRPLGRRYADSPELRTLNETVANMAAEEIAELVVGKHPIDELDQRAPDSTRWFRDAVLRDLRRDVDALLAQGQVDDAEALMEERRRELAEAGFFYRRINQAFFASRSFYADTGASIDPLGPKLELLREQSASLHEFIDAAEDLTSKEDLDNALRGSA
jgi:hypothetical protein